MTHVKRQNYFVKIEIITNTTLQYAALDILAQGSFMSTVADDRQFN